MHAHILTHTHTHILPSPSRHRCLNMFLQTYCSQWLVSSEHYTHDHLTEELLDKQDYLVSRRREEMKRMPEDEQRRLREFPPPDPLTQLLHMFKRIATSREWYMYMYMGQLGTKLILYSGKVWRALNLVNWLSLDIGEI